MLYSLSSCAWGTIPTVLSVAFMCSWQGRLHIVVVADSERLWWSYVRCPSGRGRWSPMAVGRFSSPVETRGPSYSEYFALHRPVMLPPTHPPQILAALISVGACSSAGVRIRYRWSWTRGDWWWRRHVVLTVGSWSPLPRVVVLS